MVNSAPSFFIVHLCWVSPKQVFFIVQQKLSRELLRGYAV